MITTIVTADDFVQWLKKSDSYKNSFSVNGAYALFEYLDDLSEELQENFEFDPIAWCVEYSEYSDFDAFQHDTGYVSNGVSYRGYDNINSLDELKDNTVIIEFDGGIIVQDF